MKIKRVSLVLIYVRLIITTKRSNKYRIFKIYTSYNTEFIIIIFFQQLSIGTHYLI